jgi:hypothetical protein
VLRDEGDETDRDAHDDQARRAGGEQTRRYGETKDASAVPAHDEQAQ